MGSTNNSWELSSLRNALRMSLMPWIEYSKQICNNKCLVSGEPYEVIHHKHPFYKIFFETFAEIDIPYYDDEDIKHYTSEELKIIRKKLLELHFKYGSGACLTNQIHNEFHDIYGFNVGVREFEEYLHSKRNELPINKEEIRNTLTNRRKRKGKDTTRDRMNVINIKKKKERSPQYSNFIRSLKEEFTDKEDGYNISLINFKNKYNIHDKSYRNYQKYPETKELYQKLNIKRKGNSLFIESPN